MIQEEWKRYSSSVGAFITILILDHYNINASCFHIKMSEMPRQLNGCDCGVFTCMVRYQYCDNDY